MRRRTVPARARDRARLAAVTRRAPRAGVGRSPTSAVPGCRSVAGGHVGPGGVSFRVGVAVPRCRAGPVAPRRRAWPAVPRHRSRRSTPTPFIPRHGRGRGLSWYGAAKTARGGHVRRAGGAARGTVAPAGTAALVAGQGLPGGRTITLRTALTRTLRTALTRHLPTPGTRRSLGIGTTAATERLVPPVNAHRGKPLPTPLFLTSAQRVTGADASGRAPRATTRPWPYRREIRTRVHPIR